MMKVRLAITALMAFAMVAALFVGVPERAQAQTPGLPFGPWADRLIWSEQTNSGIALEQIKAAEGDLFMFSLQGGSEKTDAFLSPDVLATSTFGSVNGLLFNPNRQAGDDVAGQNAMNPFADSGIRTAMQRLIDRNFLNLEALDGFATSFVVPFHPKEQDYFREIGLFQELESTFAPDTAAAQTLINTRMAALGATRTAGTCSQSTGANCWVDSFGDPIILRIMARIEDERLFIGQYVGQQLGRVGFRVEVVPIPSSSVSPIVYGGDPSVGAWHVYTEGWAFTSNTAWDDGQLYFFHACALGIEPFCDNQGGTYTVPADFLADAADLANGQYQSAEERQQLIRDLTPRTFTETNHRMWLQAEEAVFPASRRVEAAVFDAFGGPWTEFTLKSMKLVAGEPGVSTSTGVGGDIRVLNFVMFNDAWNPWVTPGWLYDSIQRRAIGDPGMWLHPETGRWIEYRVNVTVETEGPTGTGAVPSTALHWNTSDAGSDDAWIQVGPGVTYVSKVTTKLVAPPDISSAGKWHTGSDISLDDVVHSIAGAFRRAFGDIDAKDPRASTPGLDFFLTTVLKGLEFDATAGTVTAYIDFWHVDMQEIAAAGYFYGTSTQAPVPWEISEALFRSVLNDRTAIQELTANSRGVIWLDLGRNAGSIAAIDEAFGELNATAKFIPPSLSNPLVGNLVTSTEAAARYSRAGAFRGTYGHWYASNGPFILERINPTFRQSTMIAFRDGYPFTPDHWSDLYIKNVPETEYGSLRPTMLAGTANTLSVNTEVGGVPADAKAVRWFVRQVSTGAIPIRGDAVRTGTGAYEVQLQSTQTVGLETGAYLLTVVVQGETGSTSSNFAFSVTSQIDFFSALFDEVSDRLDDQGQSLADLGGDTDSLQTSAAGLQTLVTAVLALAVIAIVVPAAMLAVIMRRMPSRMRPAGMESPKEEL